MNNAFSNNRRAVIALFAIFALSIMLIPTAFARGTHNFNSATGQNKQDFTLHNGTDFEIKELFISPTGTDEWEEDILGRDTLASGDSLNITFTRRPEDMWDMKVVFRGGKSTVWTKLNLAKLTDVTISFKDGEPIATWKNGDH